ncbi:tyrosine-type recombinase/integrase [Deinococcus rubellus]|uniref:Tyrosine-type recombinase/integrase n=1 Tax=Deinococcus rubellus TaxID=1889240 RepID=A0ABY5YHG7_9DEIO|nr:tyrosine-type recombinase/integrase [Deinococcus rubellus]UWX64504.1 tyrosine-type recombinase/integrase [Deinococcus rubellus]
MTTDELWQQFFYHLKVKRRSKATMKYYECTQRVFGRYLAEHRLEHSTLSVLHLRGFLLSLEEKGLAPGGIHGHGRAVRALFNWASDEELITNNPAKRLGLPSLPRERHPTVTNERVKQFLSSCKTSEQPSRDIALVLTLFDTGIRLQELTELRLEDLLFDRGLLRVMGKGSKERFVPIGAKTMQTITNYLRKERKPNHAGVRHVFLSRTGQQLTKSGVGIRLMKLGKSQGMKREDTAPHAFRRGFAVEFLRNGGDVFTLQQIMGHTNLEMTRRYVTFLDDDLKTAHLRFSPVDRL